MLLAEDTTIQVERRRYHAFGIYRAPLILAQSAAKRVRADDILRGMDRIQLYGYVACAAGAAALITGLLPQDKMEKVSAFMHKHFGKEGAKRDERVSARLQLIVFGIFFLFIGLMMSGLIRR